MKSIDLHSYSIHFDEVVSTLANLIEELDYSSLFVLVDENTRAHCLPVIKGALPQAVKYIEIPSGEIHKNLETCQHIWSTLLSQGADRRTLLINLGGGVIGDMGGFCASTYMRGIRFIQIPTTLLSQVDASVGSKLGIDFAGAKNIIGLFNDPVAVLIDPSFLKTLPASELRSGYAEVIKHALIYDADLWGKLLKIDKVGEVSSWDEIIYRSVEIKKEIVEQDRKEASLRKILNFGHTIGHALESNFLETDSPLLHGEAIAWGMIAELRLSEKWNGLDKASSQGAQKYIEKIYGDKKLSTYHVDVLIEYMRQDKKNVNQQISFSLLSKIGQCEPDQFVSESNISKLISSF